MPDFRRLGSLLLGPALRVRRVWRRTARSVAILPDVLEAVLVLPRVSQQLEVIAFQTATLQQMHEEIARVRGDTAALPPIHRTLEQVAAALERVDANTAAVDELVQIMLPLGRLTNRRAGRRALGVSVDRPPA